MWKVIRECLPNRDSDKPIWQKGHKVLANEFNEYFASVGKTAADKVKKLAEVNNFQITTALPPSGHTSLDLFEFRTITPDEVRRIIVHQTKLQVPIG